MKVIVPSFNNEHWIERTLESVADQDHPNVHVLVIDDASTDGSRGLTASLCGRYGFGFTQNEANRRAAYNIYHGIHSMRPDPDEPIFILDGDDFLPHQHCLSRIEEVYEDPDAWFVYAQYEPHPHNTGQTPSRPYPPEWLLERGRLRREENYCNHPITFRYFLFCGLTLQDLIDERHRWLRSGYDRVLFIPMLEMAGNGHVRFVDEVLYSYNAVNPISDTYVNLADAQEAHRFVLRRHPKAPLPEPLPHRTAVTNV